MSNEMKDWLREQEQERELLKKGIFFDDYGQELRGVHSAEACAELHCPIHNPSEEAQAIGRLHWRNDRRFFERICSHGVGHPDPDDINADPVHGCDGCCYKAGAK